MPAHVVAYVGPHTEQDALTFVVARAVLMGSAEVAGYDRPVDGADDLAERDVVGRAGQDVAPAHAPLRSDQPGTLERQQDLLEVGLGQARALSDVAHRGRGAPVLGMECEREQCPGCVIAPGRDLHPAIVRERLASARPVTATPGDRRLNVRHSYRGGGLVVWA